MSNPSATNTEAAAETQTTATITMTVHEQGGELERIISLFRRRIGAYSAINITAGTEARTSRVTIKLRCTTEKANQAFEHLQKMPSVHDVQMYHDTDTGIPMREFALIRVAGSSEQRRSLIKLINAAGARVVDVAENGLTIEISDSPTAIDAFIHQLSSYGMHECVRTGGLTLK
jgi:acetolactate synthase I/III small subunit